MVLQQNIAGNRTFGANFLGETLAHDRIGFKLTRGAFQPGGKVNGGPDYRGCDGFALANVADNSRAEIKPDTDAKRLSTIGGFTVLPFGNLGYDGLTGTLYS